MLRIRRTPAAVATARLWAEVDLGAVRANVARFRARLPAGCRLIAVVKADGYGHGAVAVARAALQAGAAELAVGDAHEGAQLRGAGIDAPILVAGPSPAALAPLLRSQCLTPAVADLELARALAAGGGPVDIEIEVDTGMRRHGVAAADLPAFAAALQALPALRVTGVYTHFAGLGAAAGPAMAAQLQTFAAALGGLGPRGTLPPPRRHACNTLATCLLPAAHLDAVRIGGGLYGFDPGVGDLGLRPALTLKTRVLALRRAAAGDPVGYGSIHRCAGPTVLALLPCGYADGLPRAHWNGAEVLVRGRRARIVGNVSMAQLVVDVGAIPDVAVGDEVVLLGRQGADCLPARVRDQVCGSPYELTCLLRPDLLRLHFDAAGAAAARGDARRGAQLDRAEPAGPAGRIGGDDA